MLNRTMRRLAFCVKTVDSYESETRLLAYTFCTCRTYTSVHAMEFPSHLTSAGPLLLAAPLVIYLLWRFAGRLMRLYFIRKYTTIEGLPVLGLKRDQKIKGTAVVCGGRSVKYSFYLYGAHLNCNTVFPGC